jgi:hypothetical protein
LFTNRKFVVTAGVTLFLIAIGIGSGYYLWVARVNRKPGTPPVIVDRVTTTPVVNDSVPTSTIENPPDTTTTVDGEVLITFPSTILADSRDADNDGVTDVEEEILNTDPGVADTDQDKYPDGHEVYYLYNPAGKEPERVIDSGSVKEFVNQVFNYQLYYPSTWAVGPVDTEYRDVLFSALTGENIEVRVFDKEPQQDFASWFSIHAPREKFDDLVEFSTYFKQSGFRRSDYLVYYFMSQDKVYVVAYHAVPNASTINYRTVAKIIARSFRFPDQSSAVVPPTIPVTTSSTEAIVTSSEMLEIPIMTSSTSTQPVFE